MAEDWLHNPKDAGKCDSPQWLDRSRLEYFTRATSTALFDRSEWFTLRLNSSAMLDFDYIRGDGTHFRVRLRPPALVLLEAPTCPWQWMEESGRMPKDELRVGFLVLDVHFPDTANPPNARDILQFNERFRYVSCPYPGHLRHGYLKELANAPCQMFTSRLSSASMENNSLNAVYEARWHPLIESVRCLWPGCGQAPAQDSWWEIVPDFSAFADQRAFVWSSVEIDPKNQSTERLLENIEKASEESFNPLPRGLGYWIKLLNVDSVDWNANWDAIQEASPFELGWGSQRTHKRWAHDGSLIGFNHHAGVRLAKVGNPVPVWLHFGQIYFDQLLLLLQVRMALFQFSHGLSKAAAAARAHPNEVPEAITEELNGIRTRFTLFTNLFQFPLISNQQQGLELYIICRKQLDVDELYQELSQQIHTTAELFSSRAESEVAMLASQLSTVAMAASMVGLVLAFLACDTFFSTENWNLRLLTDLPPRFVGVVGCLVICAFIAGAIFLAKPISTTLRRWTVKGGRYWEEFKQEFSDDTDPR